MKHNIYKKIFTLFSLLVGTIFTATLLYHFFEKMSLFDAFYMTIITLSTVGFAEPETFSRAGRIITIFVIVNSVTIVAYSVGSLLRLVVEGEIQHMLGRNRVDRSISKLKNHFIICGYGRIGRLITQELIKNERDCIVIEKEIDVIDELEANGLLFVHGDATQEESLMKAGIMRAKGIVTVVESDANNVFIVLTARSLNPNIYILARANEVSTESKLKRAGATKVALPYMIGGHRMAQALIRPNVVDFIDIAMVDSELGLQMGEGEVSRASSLVGKTLIESNLRRNYGIIIVAIRKLDGTMLFNPTSDVVLEELDVIVMIGAKKDLERLKSIM